MRTAFGTRFRTAIPCIAIGACVIAAYHKTAWNPFVIWDDKSLIVDNPAVHAMNADTLRTIFTTFDPELYIPLTLLSYQIEYAFAGANPALFHLTNLALHALNACLVFLLTLRIVREKRSALFAGMLFAVHPLLSETVLWASARKDLLVTAFFLLTMIVMIRKEKVFHPAALGLFILALLSKVTAVMLPIALLALSWSEKKSLRASARPLLQLLPLCVIFGIVAMIGKEQKIGVLNVGEKLLVACRSVTFTLERLIVPHTLSALHPYYGEVSLVDFTFGMSAVLCAALVLTAWILRRRLQPIPAFGIAFFLIMLLPSFANQTKGVDIVITFDRYAYLPSIGIFIAAAGLMRKVFDRHGNTALLACMPIACLLIMLCWKQTAVWSSTRNLFENVAAHYPQSSVAQEHLGNIAFDEGRYRDAVSAYSMTLAHREDKAAGYVNLGAAYSKLGENEKEREAYAEALRINPRQIAARYNLARSYEEDRMREEALSEFRIILEVDPSFLDTTVRVKTLEKALGNDL